jgi:hypothetical protein
VLPPILYQAGISRDRPRMAFQEILDFKLEFEWQTGKRVDYCGKKDYITIETPLSLLFFAGEL